MDEFKCTLCGYEGTPIENAVGSSMECPKCGEPVRAPSPPFSRPRVREYPDES